MVTTNEGTRLELYVRLNSTSNAFGLAKRKRTRPTIPRQLFRKAPPHRSPPKRSRLFTIHQRWSKCNWSTALMNLHRGMLRQFHSLRSRIQFSLSSLHRRDRRNHSPSTVVYDLLPKPCEGIPIPRFPPHIAAFLNGNGDANQLNALVQALYQEIVKYEL